MILLALPPVTALTRRGGPSTCFVAEDQMPHSLQKQQVTVLYLAINTVWQWASKTSTQIVKRSLWFSSVCKRALACGHASWAFVAYRTLFLQHKSTDMPSSLAHLSVRRS